MNMALDIKYVVHNEHIEVTLTGSYEMDCATKGFNELLAICKASCKYKVLLDYSKLDQLYATEKSMYALSVMRAYEKYLSSGGRELQFAYVTSMRASYEPGADLLEGGPFAFMLFDKVDLAKDWLGL
jgi:hypothetical protein